MNPLQEFLIPIHGLKLGLHLYEFDIKKSFFQAFDTDIKGGELKVQLDLDRSASMITLNFDFFGNVAIPCDRCLNIIDLPIDAQRELVVKFADEPKEEESIVFIKHETSTLDISKYIFESINFALPLKRVKDCNSEDYKDCNKKVLSYLQGEEEIEKKDTAWTKALKDINFNK